MRKFKLDVVPLRLFGSYGRLVSCIVHFMLSMDYKDIPLEIGFSDEFSMRNDSTSPAIM